MSALPVTITAKGWVRIKATNVSGLFSLNSSGINMLVKLTLAVDGFSNFIPFLFVFDANHVLVFWSKSISCHGIQVFNINQ